MFAKNRMGFMPGLFVAFRDELDEKDLKKFIGLKNEEERADFVLNHVFIRDKFNNIRGIEGKDNAKAAKAREEGNKEFQAGNFKAALVKYNMATCQAQQDTKAGGELSLALANRSAALQKLKLYTKGVADVDRALEAGYPQDKLFKLFERKGLMLIELRKYDQARDCFSKAKKMVHNSSLNDAKIEKFVSDMDKHFDKIKDKKDSSDDTSQQKSSPQDKHSILQIQHPHPKYKSLDEAVEIKYTVDQGRFAVASRDIPAGTSILVEEPLGWTLEAEHFSTHCQHCLCEVSVPVPCRGCCSVVFCSDTCRDESWTRYHARECGILALCVAAALNNFSIIAVRALARSHVSEVLRVARATCSPDIEHGTTSDQMGVYSGEDIVTGLNLVHHSHTLSQDDQLMRTLGELLNICCSLQSHSFHQTHLISLQSPCF